LRLLVEYRMDDRDSAGGQGDRPSADL